MGFWQAVAGCFAVLAIGCGVAGRVSFARDRAKVLAMAEGFLADAAWLNEVDDIVRNWDPEMDDTSDG